MKRFHHDWVDLGNLTVACLTVPDTCGPDGATFSAWIKLDMNNCPHNAGIISSYSSYKTAFTIDCQGSFENKLT